MLQSHGDVWTTIARLSAEGGRKQAAVAYVSSDITLKFRDGDTLITNASDDAVAAGQTSGRVLQRAFQRGARLFSLGSLHAKCMLLDSTLIVGSANISVRSRDYLVEAVLVTSQRELISQAQLLIRRLELEATEINEQRIERLLEIESSRPRSSTVPKRLGEPHIVFFKEILIGDVKKYERRSADAGTGGGARDLRVSPSGSFGPFLRQMISEPTAQTGVTHGNILSRTRGGGFRATDVELWRPTDARDRELRIARVYEVPAWSLSEADFLRGASAGETRFYVLEMDEFGSVFAKILTRTQLTVSHSLLAEHLTLLESRRRGNRAIVGAVDLVQRTTVP